MNFSLNNNSKIIVLGIVVLLVVIAWPFILYFFIDSSEIASAERGQFGDMYGTLTSLFSGVTLVFLVYTIFQQNNMLNQQRQDYKIAVSALEKQEEELKLNRKELRLNRKELKDSRKEFQQQNRTLRYQRFETSFFNLIKLHQTNADSFNEIRNLGSLPDDLKSDFGNLSSVSMFSAFERGVVSAVSSGSKSKDLISSYPQLLESYNKKFLSHVTRHYTKYLMSFENVFTFITERKKKSLTRYKYFKILAAQLSIQEKIFLYYHFGLIPKNDHPEYWLEFCHVAFRGLKQEYFTYWPLVIVIEKEVSFLPKHMTP